MKVENAVALYLKDVEVTYAAKTHRAYSQRLVLFVSLLGHRALARLRSDDIATFVTAARVRPDGRLYAPDTVRLTIVAFEQFQKWAIRVGHLKAPITNGTIPKPPGRMRERVPTGEEQYALLSHATQEFKRIFQALRVSGARPAELTAANIADYDIGHGLIVLDEHKSSRRQRRSRRIGVGHKLREVMQETIAGRTEGPLFLDEKGLRWRPQQLSARFRRYRDKAGLSKDIVLYSATRHEHGMRITKQLGIFAANHSLGHSPKSLDATMRYAHADDRRLGGYQDAVYDF